MICEICPFMLLPLFTITLVGLAIKVFCKKYKNIKITAKGTSTES